MIATHRRYDIDWLRVITIGLLLIYHIAIVFQPWGILIGFIQSKEYLEALWTPMSMLNVWRIPLLFFVSGMGVSFAIGKRSWKQLLAERAKRILLPFTFGALIIVPIHVLVFLEYYSLGFSYAPSAGHLWFLGNIFIYVLVLSPIFFYMKKHTDSKLNKWFAKVFETPVGLVLIIIPFVVEALIVNPDIFEMYAMSIHGFVLGMLAFLSGFCLIQAGSSFWEMVLKWRWPLLILAVGLFLVRYFMFQLKSPNYMMAIESNIWICAVLGFGYKYLNKPSSTLSYLSQAAYPIYILHMALLYIAAYLILPLEIHTVLKLILILLFTTAGCFMLYDFVIKRVHILRLLFGLKTQKVK